MSEPLVVIGNGMAAMHLVEELTRRALGRYAIAVIGEEPRLAYNRVLLSAVLAQEVSSSEIELRPARWWSHRGVTLLYGRTATVINSTIRRVRLADGAGVTCLTPGLCLPLVRDQSGFACRAWICPM